VKFSEIFLHPALQRNLDQIQFLECTKIQEQAIPWIRKGKDVAGLAQTGTGKTGAFLVPLIDRMLKAVSPDPATESSETQAFTEWKKKQFVLVLVPTRELAEQVQENAKKFLAGTGFQSVAVYGGTTYDKQVAALKQGVEFVIATPGRLIDLYKEHIADLAQVRAVVFDEADRMFDMGFKDDMKFILRRLPRDRQFMVFSATLNFDVLNTAYEFGADPVEISISRDQAKAENVKDYIIHLGQDEKPKYLLSLLRKTQPRQAIIFSNFKHNVERLTRFLNSNGIPAVGISSLLTQGQRNRVMEQFRAENDRNILVATDVAARGLDIIGVDLVINMELPDDAENYVHRIGRTGRAGHTGQAWSLVSDRDVDALQRIEDYLKHKVESIYLDDSELVAEFKPIPAMEREHRPARPMGGGGGHGGGRGGSGGGSSSRRDSSRPRRSSGGDSQSRSVRGESGGGGHGGRGGSGGGSASSDQPHQHRDRRSGRHGDSQRGGGERDRGGGNGPSPHQQGGGRGGGANASAGRSSQGGGQSQGRRPHSQDARGGGSQRGGSRHGGSGGGGSSQQRRDHRGGGGGTGSKGSRPPLRITPRPPPGLGAKVSGFFKKLFGGKPS